MTDFSSDLLGDWATQLSTHSTTTKQPRPSYWADDASSLYTRSSINHTVFGAGETLISSIIPSILAAEHEVLLVTCFWARSTSQHAIGEALKQLSVQAISRGTHKIRVRICFSSLSLTQKLFHTFSRHGQIYPPATWAKKFNLPAPEEISGLDLEIKSIFFLPFSVMHPKYIIIDRRQAWLPSCNVSWEQWLEGCVAFQGDAVRNLLEFHQHVWGHHVLDSSIPLDDYDDSALSSLAVSGNANTSPGRVSAPLDTSHVLAAQASSPNQASEAPVSYGMIPTLILPSPHHINPRFRLLPFLRAAAPPPTPLNTFTLALLANAHTEIYIQTPNLTSPPVLDAIIDALSRGVAVTIVTNRRLMVLEQLLTAGTLTELCVWRLVRRYKALRSKRSRHAADISSAFSVRNSQNPDLEAGVSTTHRRLIGRLRISYYEPFASLPVTNINSTADRTFLSERSPSGPDTNQDVSRDQNMNPNIKLLLNPEPNKSHLKLLVVDSSIVLLGSGNMDRASWYTSQELGMAFSSEPFARDVLGTVRHAVSGREEVYFSSDE